MPEAESQTNVSVAAHESEAPTVELSEQTIETSSPFIGQWNQLVSSTNWEKGRIISRWRAELEESGAGLTEYSDEAWSRLVGNVTSQHVGRLRRVHDRFGSKREEYDGLFWSHFQAAIDWDDAEMWLEGAITNAWSVSRMRAARWEAVGAPDGVRPSDEEVIASELDEDAYASLTDPGEPPVDPADYEASGDKSVGAGSDSPSADRETSPVEQGDPDQAPGGEAAQRPRPFENLAELPDDVGEAFEQFKLVILSHKLTGWEAISLRDMLACLDSLKALAEAPSDND